MWLSSNSQKISTLNPFHAHLQRQGLSTANKPYQRCDTKESGQGIAPKVPLSRFVACRIRTYHNLSGSSQPAARLYAICRRGDTNDRRHRAICPQSLTCLELSSQVLEMYIVRPKYLLSCKKGQAEPVRSIHQAKPETSHHQDACLSTVNCART